MKGAYLEHMTWIEAEEALRRFNLILLPLGARCKEHGHHLPLNNDWRIAEYLTRRVLEEVEALALPTIQYNYFPAFVEYPGSINIGEETSRELINDICRSLYSQALVLGKNPKFYVINTGISTVVPLEKSREVLKREGIEMNFLDLRNVNQALIREISTQEAGTHADEIETSMMLYIAPEIVHMDRAKRDIHAERGTHGPLTRHSQVKGLYSPTGAWGDPTLATREKGQQVVENLVSYLVKRLK